MTVAVSDPAFTVYGSALGRGTCHERSLAC